MSQVALITGGSRGIGRGIALQLAGLRFDVVINYAQSRGAAEATAEQCRSFGANAEIFQADIAQASDRQNLVAFTRERFGRLDVLVNNAGIAPLVRADILDASEESFDHLIATNLKGPYFLTQLVARWMIEQQQIKTDVSTKKIIIISSVSAYVASTNRGDYCVAKAGLSMTTKLFASRLAEHAIGVYEIRPGIIETDMTAAVKDKYNKLIADGLTPMKRWGTPNDVAKAVSAIVQDLLPFSVGEVINVDGGFHLQCL